MESIMYAVSIFAGILTTASFMPQAIKTIRTKNTRGISLIMYIVLIAGLFMWFVYGVYLKNVSIIFSNLITLIFASVILVMKIRYK
ncbi:MAG TPA: SemiSWEET transporter [Spirochaetota bacterium]|nr:SemiSWEET transporter [Spirochaetota bacterium]